LAYAITDEHSELAVSVRSVLAATDALGDARAALDGALAGLPLYWKQAASLGWLGLHIEERFGGQGFGLPELAVVIEELGYVCAPGPFLTTTAAAAVIAQAGTDEQMARWLPGLCSGERVATVAFGGSASGDRGTVSGASGYALFADSADLLLIPVGDDLLAVESGPAVQVNERNVLDRTRPVGAITCERAPILGVLADGVAVAQRVNWALVAVEASGGMRACTDRAVAYAKQREQFGRMIGSFQAVKHHLANLLVECELATAAAWDATRPATGDREGDLIAAVAAAQVLPAYQRVAEQNIQLHGGIGFTWEHDAHLYMRRSAALAVLFGGVEQAATVVRDLRRAGVRRAASFELPEEADAHRHETRLVAEKLAAAPAGERRRALARSGYLVPHWPEPYGRAAGPVEQLVIEDEMPDRPGLGLGEWLLPTLVQYGTDEQKQRWIWPSLEGDIQWCQLFSEPDAGSDAAAIRTRARRTDGGWIVTGQKVWNSLVEQCEFGLLTVRTNPDVPKHQGITVVALDMSSPGVTVRPLREITGDSQFNEVFLDDVFIADVDVIGEVDEGWLVTRATFGNERVSLGSTPLSMEADDLLDVLERRCSDDPVLGQELGRVLAESQALRALNLRRSVQAVFGDEAGPEANIAKLVGAEHAQRVGALGMRLAGVDGVLGGEQRVAHDYLFARCLTIAGGTSEIMRNVIAERFLGLPRER
jgi:3-oxochol-4-en-24-oyl-CoA dehydrogenase